MIRRAGTERTKLAELGAQQELDDQGEEAAVDHGAVADDRLRLVFTCCHPALSMEARVALTLKVVAGLATDEVARMFLVGEATMSQRLLRAKKRIANAGIPYQVPEAADLAERLDGVLAVVYLVFTQGYAGAAAPELAEEAIRLGRLLADLMPDEDEVTRAARADARPARPPRRPARRRRARHPRAPGPVPLGPRGGRGGAEPDHAARQGARAPTGSRPSSRSPTSAPSTPTTPTGAGSSGSTSGCSTCTPRR